LALSYEKHSYESEIKTIKVVPRPLAVEYVKFGATRQSVP